METQSIRIELPKKMYRRLEKLATATNQTIDAVVLQTIRGNLPPVVEDLPSSMRAEFSALLRLKDKELLQLARTPINPTRWRRHQRLLAKNAEGELTTKEQVELEKLRAEADEYVLRKSFALALLKWRGHALFER
jgi:hypothetical protein